MNQLIRSITKLALAPHSRTATRSFAKKSPKVHEMEAIHIPVMKKEVLDLWAANLDGAHLIDGTVGLGGHSVAALEGGAKVLGIDRDLYAVKMVKRRFDALLHRNGDDKVQDEEREEVKDEETSNNSYSLHHGSYTDISPDLLKSSSFPPKVDGILLDLGVNSYQLQNRDRGFTFRKYGPLDMRFDAHHGNHNGSSLKARQIINTYTVDQLTSMFQRHSDENNALRIAEAIHQWRIDKATERGSSAEISSTLELRYIIESCMNSKTVKKKIPPRKPHGMIPKETKSFAYRKIWRHCAEGKMLRQKRILRLQSQYEEAKVQHVETVMRCFQALRIETNEELGHLHSFLSNSANNVGNVLKVGGRLIIIAFQPGEDVLVRSGMEQLVKSGEFRLLTPDEEGLRPTEEEVGENGRARTARLRAVEKIK